MGLFAPLAQSQPTLDFYATAAEVLPVLLLALAFEFRGTGMVFLPSALLKTWARPEPRMVSFEPGATPSVRLAAPEREEPPPWWAAGYTALVALALLLGEATALWVLATGAASDVARVIVGTVLGIGGLAILGPVLILQLNVLLRAIPEESRGRVIGPITNVDLRFVQTIVALASIVAALLSFLEGL